MTWILAADDASEDELREIAAHQRELAEERRAYDRTIAYINDLELPELAAGDRVPVSGTAVIPGRDEASWLHALYARVYVFLIALRPC